MKYLRIQQKREHYRGVSAGNHWRYILKAAGCFLMMSISAQLHTFTSLQSWEVILFNEWQRETITINQTKLWVELGSRAPSRVQTENWLTLQVKEECLQHNKEKNWTNMEGQVRFVKFSLSEPEHLWDHVLWTGETKAEIFTHNASDFVTNTSTMNSSLIIVVVFLNQTTQTHLSISE